MGQECPYMSLYHTIGGFIDDCKNTTLRESI